MAMKVSVTGLRELEAALSKLPKNTGKNVLRRILKKAGQPIAETAARLAPDRPGKPRNDLAESISVSTKLNKNQKKITRGGDKAYVELYVGPDTSVPMDHGHWQEFGTVNHGPSPFMRPAWDAEKGNALEIIKDDLGGEIMKAAQRLAKKAAKGK